MMNYMPFFGLNNVEFEIFRQGVGNHAARKIQWAYRRYKFSSAETLMERVHQAVTFERHETLLRDVFFFWHARTPGLPAHFEAWKRGFYPNNQPLSTRPSEERMKS